jgi:hypothetical protein
MEDFFIHPAYRETVRELSRELQSYGEKFKDPYITQPAIKAALAWAVKGKEPYEPKADKQPGDSEGAGQKKKAEKRRRQQKSKQEG